MPNQFYFFIDYHFFLNFVLELAKFYLDLKLFFYCNQLWEQIHL